MMIGKGDISPWFPEPDLVMHQALGKLVEECSELAKIAARCMIQGVDQQDPKTASANRYELMKEIADVQACISWVSSVVDLPAGMSSRGREKIDGFRRWQRMLEAGK